MDQGGGAVVLTHFCETHGPSVVFTTQAFPRVLLPSTLSIVHLPPREPTLSPPDTTRSGAAEQPKEEAPVDTSCTTCRSVPDGTGLTSVDEDDREMCFLSTHNPSAPIYATVRTACVRSLSCEVAPRDGPVLFSTGTPDGEGREWGVVSYVFRVADGQARGASRMYSILVMHSDVTLLIHSFAWLSGSLRAIVNELIARAKQNASVPQDQQAPFAQTRSMPRNPSYRRVTRTVSLRPLVDLMDDKNFFHKIHSRFCWIMQSCIRRIDSRMYRIPHVVDDTSTTVNSGTGMPLGKLRTMIGNDGFHSILYNVLIGNQLVIRGDAIDLAVSIAYSFSLLLPAGCGAHVRHFMRYLHAYEASFLVIPMDAPVPHDLDPTQYVLVELVPNPENPQRITFNVVGCSEITTLGTDIEKIIGEDKNKEDMKLSILVEEWVTKAKTFVRLRPLCTSPQDPKLKTFAKALTLMHEEADFRVLAFWTTGLRKAVRAQEVV